MNLLNNFALQEGRGMDRWLYEIENSYQYSFGIYPLLNLRLSKLIAKENLDKYNLKIVEFNDSFIIHNDNGGVYFKPSTLHNQPSIIVSPIENFSTIINKKITKKIIMENIKSEYFYRTELAEPEIVEQTHAFCKVTNINLDRNLPLYSADKSSIYKNLLIFKEIMPDFAEAISNIKEIAAQKLVDDLNEAPGLQNYNDILSLQLNDIFKYAVKKKYIHNDGDNYFYKKDNMVVMGNSTYEFHIVEKDGVYNISTKDVEEDPEDLLEKNEFLFDSNNNKFSLVELNHSFTLPHFIMYLHYGLDDYKEKHKIKNDDNDKMLSYEYLLAYNSYCFNVNKEETIWRALFYGFPKGVDKNGNYNPNANLKLRPYVLDNMYEIISNIVPNTFTCPIVYDNTKIFKKIKKVNENWLPLFEDGNYMVTEFIQKYKAADKATQENMLLSNNREAQLELLEIFLTESERIIKNSTSLKLKP